MNNHIGDEQLIGYVHYTLTDAERETMDVHLRVCPECRTRLTDIEVLERRVRYDLSAEMQSVAVPASMTYSAIAPRLARRRPWERWRTPSGQFLPGATAFAGLAGLAVALISAFHVLGWGGAAPGPVTTSRLPVLACGCFAVAVMGQYSWATPLAKRLLVTRALALALWLGTAIVGLQVIVTVLDMVTWLLYSGFSSRTAVLGVWILIPMSVAWIGLVVGGGEFHYRHIGERASWRAFGLTVAIEMLILLLPYLLGIWFDLPPIWR